MNALHSSSNSKNRTQKNMNALHSNRINYCMEWRGKKIVTITAPDKRNQVFVFAVFPIFAVITAASALLLRVLTANGNSWF